MTDPQPDWSARLALSVAHEVRRHRQDQGLSAQQLSDRCAEIGMPIQRSVLANLESGRRTTVTIAEVLILAAALNIPPVLLVFPLGHAESCEVLPGETFDVLKGIDWFSGNRAEPVRGRPYANNAIFLYRRHRAISNNLRKRLIDRESARVKSALAQVGGTGEQLDLAQAELEMLRSQALQYRREVKSEVASTSPEAEARRTRIKEMSTYVEHLRQRDMERRYAEDHLRMAEKRVTDDAMELWKVRADIKHAGWVLPWLGDDLQDAITESEKRLDGLVDEMEGPLGD
ncbi:helix-turn-helix transcriptional regulator [Streptomyces sp. SID12488]|uniref:helix-turn-helix domain-containing protein n=1 Tax=Streptomyces sp. SID12488 TaxID=2706040 RepID=UPI0013DAC1EF|nr:helix-turn-helix transcriptional regulator [Streptomyces sp. SID12488]NEA67519.1 helix-turn-helix domain-containing protein [Streptomyces sp. SID12488]